MQRTWLHRCELYRIASLAIPLWSTKSTPNPLAKQRYLFEVIIGNVASHCMAFTAISLHQSGIYLWWGNLQLQSQIFSKEDLFFLLYIHVFGDRFSYMIQMVQDLMTVEVVDSRNELLYNRLLNLLQ